MITKSDLNKLSSREIANLWTETRNLALRERSGVADDQPTKTGGNSPYHLSPDRSVCTDPDCGGLASHYPPEERFYMDESGAMLPLLPGQERPASLEDERTERICRLSPGQIENLDPQTRAEVLEFKEAVAESRALTFRELRPDWHRDNGNLQVLLDHLCHTHLGVGYNDFDGDDEELIQFLLSEEYGQWTI